jgi:hypothetical protein
MVLLEIIFNLVDTIHKVPLKSLNGKTFMIHFTKCLYDCLETIL